jgi:uncharacterized repeat protein (TIGR03803 family)
MKSLLVFAAGLFLSASALAQSLTLSQLFAFSCVSTPPYACSNGAEPVALIQASDGNFYGVTQTSFASHSNTVHLAGGTIFKITASGQFTLLYTFKQNTTTGFYDQGSIPNSIAEGSDGNLYGAAGGGPNAASAGVLFKISKSGTGFKVIENYCTTCTTGGFPDNIIAAPDGNLYGTTTAGGAFSCQGLGCGVVFRLTTAGGYTVLHSFTGGSDTQAPLGVIYGSDGNLYGTTSGTVTGTIFRVNPSSGAFTTLYTFPSGTHSVDVATEGSGNLLYGTSRPGTSGTLTVYSSTLGGSENNLVTINFGSFKRIGVGPFLLASDGNEWTTSSVNSTSPFYGSVFAVSPSGAVVHDILLDGSKGAAPVAGVLQTSNGTLYLSMSDRGTTSGGQAGYGAIASITGLAAK